MMSATMPKLRKIRYHRRVALELPAFCDRACFRSEASIRRDLADRSFVQKTVALRPHAEQPWNPATVALAAQAAGALRAPGA